MTVKILLVDDEPSVGKAIARLLRHGLSHSLLPAPVIEIFTDGHEALRRAHVATFALAISDYRMPLLNGVELLSQMRVLQPECTRVILSGYTDLNGLMKAINEAQIARFIAKPWNDHELLCTIQQLLQIQALNLENIRLAGQAREHEGLLSPQERERRRLESADPGITRVNWGPDGSFILEEPEGDNGAAGERQRG